jgi:BirA family transcriptional regulator, biotin operon repressor / biotin---[acetyl-CoA-carboxylase] ligase
VTVSLPQVLSEYDGTSVSELATLCGAPSIEVWKSIGSTQDRAHELAQEGAAHGTAVVAVQQQAGRGRSGDAWISGAGDGVWVSVVLRDVGQMPPGVLALRVGFALAPRLDGAAGSLVQLKWPNDVYVQGRKVAGILSEARWVGGRAEWTVVGLGINVRAPEQMPHAAGLRAGTRCRDVCVHAVQAALSSARAAGPLSVMELASFGARDMARGRRITQPIAGVVRGVAPDGALRVETPDGEQVIVAGSLRFDSDGD